MSFIRSLAVTAGLATALTGLAMAPVSAGTTPGSVTGDTFVTSLYPNNNYSTSATMRAASSPEKITLLQLSIPAVPDGASSPTPKLVLHGSGNAQPSQTVTVKDVTGSWDPTTVTYVTRPALGATLGSGTASATGTLEIPLPATATGSFDVAVTTASTSDSIFATSENPNAALRPSVELGYTDPPVPPLYGSDGVGNPRTADCSTTVPAGGDINAAITAAAAGALICVAPQDQSSTQVTLNKAVTLRAGGSVKIRNAIVSGGGTLDGFTVVGASYGAPANGVLFSGNGNRIVNNLINGHGLVRGVYCTSCGAGTVIGHNTITKISNYGIQTSNGTGIIIEWNNIYDLYDDVEGALDTDAMRPFGTNLIVRNNYMHDLNAQRSILGPDNDRPHLDCIQHYQNSSNTLTSVNLLVENNYCVRVTGIFIISKNNLDANQDMRGLTVRGNVTETYGNAELVISGVPDLTVENNSFFGATTTGPVIAVENGDGGAQMTNARIQNNVLVSGVSSNPGIGNKGGRAVAAGIITVNRDNVYWVDTDLATRDAAWAQPNPAPMDTAIVEDDFTLYRDWEQDGPALVNEGSPLLTSGFAADIEGGARVEGSAVDIGAYELG